MATVQTSRRALHRGEEYRRDVPSKLTCMTFQFASPRDMYCGLVRGGLPVGRWARGRRGVPGRRWCSASFVWPYLGGGWGELKSRVGDTSSTALAVLPASGSIWARAGDRCRQCASQVVSRKSAAARPHRGGQGCTRGVLACPGLQQPTRGSSTWMWLLHP